MVSLVCAGPASAQLPINRLPTLFGTGLSNTGASLAAGATDTHWQLVSAPTGSGYGTSLLVIPSTIFPISTNQWMNYSTANGATRWLVPNYRTTGGNTTHAVGNYIFRTTFTIPSGSSTTDLRLFFRGGVDNRLTNVRINGVATGQSFSGFSSWSSVRTINSGFVVGTNTLDFLVTNDAGTSGNPVGFRMELAATYVPEPTPLVLLLWAAPFLGIALLRCTIRPCQLPPV